MNEAEMNDFIQRVDLVNKTVKDICSNKASDQQIQSAENELGILNTAAKKKRLPGKHNITYIPEIYTKPFKKNSKL